MKTRAFTLIELLVVIAIIGLLSSVIIASLNTARSKARDAQRKTDVGQIALALALYYDAYGVYPASSYGGACGTAMNGSDIVSTNLKSGGYMQVPPQVPSNSGTCGDAYYTGTWNSAQNIAILIHLENVDANCTPWTGGSNWYTTGSYCNGYYIVAQ